MEMQTNRQEISIEFGDDGEIYDDSPTHVQNRPLPAPPVKPEQMTVRDWEEAERKRKEGTVKVTVRNSELYVRYKEDKLPDNKNGIETVLKEGTLLKRAVGKSKVGRTNWKDRFFRLTSVGLSYWDGDPRLHSTAKKKGQLPLAAIRSVKEIHANDANTLGDVPSDVASKQFILQIKYDIWTLYVQAPSASDLFDWKSLLESKSTSTRAGLRQLAYEQPWFCGSMPKSSVQEMLLAPTSSTGDYLITQSAKNPSDFSLAVRTGPNSIKSFPVVERDDLFAIRSSRAQRDTQIAKICNARFRSLPDVINAIKKGGTYGNSMTALAGCFLCRPAVKGTTMPIFAQVQQTTEALAHKLNTGGNIRNLSASNNVAPVYKQTRTQSMVARKRSSSGSKRTKRASADRSNSFTNKGSSGMPVGSHPTSSWMMGLDEGERSGSISSASISTNSDYSIEKARAAYAASGGQELYQNTQHLPIVVGQVQPMYENTKDFGDDDQGGYLADVRPADVDYRGAEPAASGFSEDPYSRLPDLPDIPRNAVVSPSRVEWLDEEEFGGFNEDGDMPPVLPPKAKMYDPEGYGFDDESDDETYDTMH